MNDKFLKFIFLLFVIGYVHTYQNSECCEEYYCYMHDDNPYLFFSTKTPYEFIHGRNSRLHMVPKCKPIQYWSINSYGTRLPDENTIHELRTQLTKLKRQILINYEIRKSYSRNGDHLCYDDFDLLKQWKWNSNIIEDHADWLTDQGKYDLKYLAKRYQTRYSDLFQIPYNESNYVFKYFNSKSIKESYKSFVEGLFPRNANRVQGISISVNDSNIETYQICDEFVDELDKINSDDYNEPKKFIEKPKFQQMIKDISTRLGFQYKLNVSTILIMYKMCQYEKAWDLRSPSAWCIAFTKEQLRMLEYYYDMKYYYETGYGNELSEKIGCIQIKEMFTYFEKIANNEIASYQPKVIAYFTDHATIQMFIVALGFKNDTYDLTADNYEIAARRQWRTAKISPFTANLAAIFYECPKLHTQYVMFLLNEEPIEYPGCHNGLCSWQSVYERLKPIVDNCNFDFCTNNEATATRMKMHRKILNLLYLIIVVIVIKNFAY